MKLLRHLSFVSFIGLAIATPALAHPHLMNATPAANSTSNNVTSITLAFDERVMAQMSGLDLTMTGMPGMANHQPTRVSGFATSVSNDGKTITARFPRALPPGSYRIDWHVVGGDTHRITGTITFSVR